MNSIPGLKMPAKDACRYNIYLQEPSAARADQVLRVVTDIYSPWSKEYIWQEEGFALTIQSDYSLSGTTRFGDCIEDEWFIVWILRESSRQCRDIFIQVTDGDGEFLLIESAMHLPRWMDPDTAAHRAWIRGGQFIIVPPSPSDILNKRTPALTLPEALEHLRQDKTVLHVPAIESDAFARIKHYPGQAHKEIHRVSCTLPRVLGTLLHHNPGLIAPLAIACYHRDDSQSAQFAASRQVLAKTRVEVDDLVETTVRFTKTLYAQLIGTRFTVPQWYPPLRPHLRSLPSARAAGVDEAAHEIGCKLVCGLVFSCHESRISAALEHAQSHLATDQDFVEWREEPDSDDFLHVNFEELEKVLAAGHDDPRTDATWQQHEDTEESDVTIKKMVEQMQKFMNTDSTFEGAEFSGDESSDLDDAENDNDEDDDDDDEDVEDGFGDEDEDFMDFLRSSMNGTSALDALRKAGTTRQAYQDEDSTRIKSDDAGTQEGQDSDSDDSVGDLKEYMAVMDAELAGHGLSSRTVGKGNDDKAGTGTGTGSDGSDDDDEQQFDAADQDLQIDFNMAKNMLESMQSMGGMQGPAAGLLGRMGISLPRNERDDLSEPLD